MTGVGLLGLARLSSVSPDSVSWLENRVLSFWDYNVFLSLILFLLESMRSSLDSLTFQSDHQLPCKFTSFVILEQYKVVGFSTPILKTRSTSMSLPIYCCLSLRRPGLPSTSGLCAASILLKQCNISQIRLFWPLVPDCKPGILLVQVQVYTPIQRVCVS